MILIAYLCIFVFLFIQTNAEAPGQSTLAWAMTDPVLNVTGLPSGLLPVQFHPAQFAPNFVGNNVDQSLLSGRILIANDTGNVGCVPYPSKWPDGTPVNGTCIGVAVRGSCPTAQKLYNAQAAGCIAFLMTACDPNPPSSCLPNRHNMWATSTQTPNLPEYKIGGAMISYLDGQTMIKATQNNPMIVLSATIPGTGPIDPVDKAALVKIARAMSNTGTIFQYTLPMQDLPAKLQQDPTYDPCTGQRITEVVCMRGHVYYIENNLMLHSGTIAPEINDLRYLEHLHFDGTSISGALPLLNMSSLRCLIIQNSKLTSMFNTVSSLVNLEAFSVQGNIISQLPPDLNVLTKLAYFDISNNKFTSLPTISSTNLFWLDASGNSINSQILNFSNQPNLLGVVLTNNKFYGNNLENYFNNLPKLQVVGLQNNQLSGLVPNFNSCPKLSIIDLSRNNFTGGLPTTWNSPSITSIDISRNKITGPFMLKQATSLTYFDASFNWINPNDPTTFNFGSWSLILSNCFPSTVAKLYLQSNKIAGPWPSSNFGGNIGSLQSLVLSYNGITSLPGDLFSFPGVIRIFDFSYNNISGDMPAATALPSTIETIKMEGNPYMKPSTGALPSWALQNLNTYASTAGSLFSCPSMYGTPGLSLTLFTIDAAYYNYLNCKCARGYYGKAPNCLDIPTEVKVVGDSNIPGSSGFTDSVYGSDRLTLGVDISWVLDYQKPSTQNIITAFFIVLTLDRNYFNQFTDIIEIYASDASLTGERVLSLRGTDADPVSNILEINKPAGTQIVLNSVATVTFRSRKQLGTHFTANFTVDFVCPNKYQFDPNTNKCQKVFQIDSNIQAAVYAVISLFVLMLVFITGVIVKKRNSLIIRSSSFPFCFSMLVFMVALGTGSYFYAINPSQGDYVCNLRPWLTAFPLVGILSALLVKVDRIRRIFSSKELVVQTITNAQLAQTMGLMLSAELALLIGFSASKMSSVVSKLGYGATSGQLVAICTSTDSVNGANAFSAWLIIQFIYIGAFLLVAVGIAWSVRKVPSAFNEAPSIASSLLSLVVLLIILIPLNYMVDDNPNALMIIRGLGQILVTSVLALFFFGPKLYLILEGKDNDKTLSSLGSSKSSSSASSSAASSNAANESNNDQYTLLLVKSIKKMFESILQGSKDTSDLVAARKNFATSYKAKMSAQIVDVVQDIENMISQSTN